jgi:hypothetical protein
MSRLKNSIIAFPVLLILVGTFATLTPVVARGQGGSENAPPHRNLRKFYLTRTIHNGSQALTACSADYHMASVWEILDPSNLRYDTELGRSADSGAVDSGFGPPSGISSAGWIRTGGGMSGGGGVPGVSNCRAWTSGSNADAGSLIYLPWDAWNLINVTVISPWSASTDTCESTRPVWCVQD